MKKGDVCSGMTIRVSRNDKKVHKQKEVNISY